jgi:dihydrofolate synthase/folylpolyglutamate synthase
MYHGGTEINNDIQLGGIPYLFSLAKWTKEKPFSIQNITKVLDYLSNIQNNIPAIIITGTNGKGSVSALISAILGASGYTVGLNISPHLDKINERILINGFPVNDLLISETALELKKIIERLDILLSFHEAMTVCAFMIFNKLQLDWQVLEVGLGGRYDAANTVKNPRASVLVSVDFDHQAILGNTLVEIATEKAAIFRESKYAIIGKMQNDVKQYLKTYVEKKHVLSMSYDKDFYISKKENGKIYYKDMDWEIEINSNLEGEHQIQNAAIAIATCKSLGISKKSCKKGILNVFWPGRLEYVRCGENKLLIDCAHNPAGVKSLISYFESRGLKEINLGFGVLSSKNWKEMIDRLLPYVKQWNLLTPPAESAVEAEDLQEYLKTTGNSGIIYGRDYNKYIDDINISSQSNLVLTGSIYLIGALRPLLTKEVKPVWIYENK